MFWDYTELPVSARWGIFVPSILVVIGANAVAIVLSIVPTHLDPDGFTTTILIAVSSTILHTFQVMSTPPRNREAEFPYVRKVLLACLFLAFSAHFAFTFYLRRTHDELFAKLSKLLCISHGVFAEVCISSFSRILDRSMRPFAEYHEDLDLRAVVQQETVTQRSSTSPTRLHGGTACLLRRWDLAPIFAQYPSRLEPVRFSAVDPLGDLLCHVSGTPYDQEDHQGSGARLHDVSNSRAGVPLGSCRTRVYDPAVHSRCAGVVTTLLHRVYLHPVLHRLGLHLAIHQAAFQHHRELLASNS